MKEQHYLRDVFTLLLERAQDARRRAKSASVTEPEERAFASGVAQGYYETIAVMLGQLDAFGIARTSVGVPEGFSPEHDLI